MSRPGFQAQLSKLVDSLRNPFDPGSVVLSKRHQYLSCQLSLPSSIDTRRGLH